METFGKIDNEPPPGTKSIVYTKSVVGETGGQNSLGNICLGWFKGDNKQVPNAKTPEKPKASTSPEK